MRELDIQLLVVKYHTCQNICMQNTILIKLVGILQFSGLGFVTLGPFHVDLFVFLCVFVSYCICVVLL